VDRQAEVHDRCMDMIDKLKTFDATINLLVKEIQVTEVISEAKTTTQTIKSSIELPQVSPAKRNAPRITDADYVVTTTAGKKIFFKNRFPLARQEETQKSPPKVIDAFDDHSITNNKFKQEEAAVTPQLEEQKNSEDNKKVCRKSLRRGLFQCKKYLNAVVFQWVRHRKKFVFAWLEDKEEEDQLILHIYQPESSHTCKLSIPFPTMRFILPQGMVWYRRSELQRCEYARKDWEKKFTYIKKCIQWKVRKKKKNPSILLFRDHLTLRLCT
jgi:hypothetical protein